VKFRFFVAATDWLIDSVVGNKFMLQHETYKQLANILVTRGIFTDPDAAFISVVATSSSELKVVAERLESETRADASAKSGAASPAAGHVSRGSAPVASATKEEKAHESPADAPSSQGAPKEEKGTVAFVRKGVNYPEHYPLVLVKWFNSFNADFVARVITPKVLQVVRAAVPGETRKVGLIDDKRWVILAQGKSFLDLDLGSAELLAEKLSDPIFGDWISKMYDKHEAANKAA
jgi:hypothetical protein